MALKKTEAPEIADDLKANDRAVSCGLVMPISSIDGCTAEHWSEVKNIICESIEGISEQKFTVKLVSDADDVGVIQKRIVQNIYSSDIVVCDVSGKNPNVMFELGLRLAFDKPTVIVKDDKTDYSFDTGIIEHIPYPRDLRFSRIVAFRSALAEKVAATYKAAQNDPNHSTFLKNFGKFQVASLSEDIVPADRLVLDILQDLQHEVARLRRGSLRETPRKAPTDALVAMAYALQTYRSENPSVSLTDLLGSETFRHEMERLSDAPNFFRGPREFQEALDELIIQAIKIDDRRS